MGYNFAVNRPRHCMLNKNKKNFIITVISVIILLYCICPPYNKAAQIGYVFNNISFYTAKNQSNFDRKEYIFHRNNAVYLAKMSNKNGAIKEINKAVTTAPNDLDDNLMTSLYKDRAKIKMFFKDYKGALDDMLKIPSPGINDMLKIAMLLKEQGNNKLAVTYCNKIIDIDIRAYAGYACIADIYAGVGKYDASVMIYDLLIDRVPNKAKYYADRAKYKKEAGDLTGYENDIKQAKELYPFVDTNSSVTYESIHPKVLDMSIITYTHQNNKGYSTI